LTKCMRSSLLSKESCWAISETHWTYCQLWRWSCPQWLCRERPSWTDQTSPRLQVLRHLSFFRWLHARDRSSPSPHGHSK
jgi:hypothetical protein